MEVLGKEESLKRIRAGIEKLSQNCRGRINIGQSEESDGI